MCLQFIRTLVYYWIGVQDEKKGFKGQKDPFDRRCRGSGTMTTSIGNFEIIEQIASGGMAVIYKARQTSLDRVVVVKELKSAFKEDKEIVARFEQEAKAVARLQHENIITIIEFWYKKGSYYIAMEYLDGADLARVIEKAGPLPLNIGLIIASHIARALGYAHEHGIVHRDLKPSNILVSQDGKVKLVDFGIAHIEEELGGKGLTRAGFSMGTPAYMSPEQTDGKPADPSSDIWSFGCVLYEIFSGKKAFAAIGKSTVIENIRKGKRSPQTDQFGQTVPWGLRRMINRCLKIKPGKRPSTKKLMTYLVDLAQKKNKGKDYSMVLRAFIEDKKLFQQAAAKTVVRQDQEKKKPVRITARAVAVVIIIIMFAGSAVYVFLRGHPHTAGQGLAAGESGQKKNSVFKKPVQPVHENAVSLPSRAVLPLSGTAMSASSAAASLTNTAITMQHAARSQSQSIIPSSRASGEASMPAQPVSPATVSRTTMHAVSVQKVSETGYIRVVALPWAEIYIDGERVGLTPTNRRFPVSAGKHRVMLKNPYYRSVNREVEVSNNRIVFIKAVLRKKREKK